MKKYDTTTRITNFNVDWMAIKSACMTTISKQAGKEPSKEWKRKLLICRHSPIRRGIISWKWDNIPYAISTHFARHHEGCEKFIGTERADRTEIKDRAEKPNELCSNGNGRKLTSSNEHCRKTSLYVCRPYNKRIYASFG